jgi:hypothetical protein
MMRVRRHVEDGSFRENVGHLVPQFGSDAQPKGASPIEAAPAKARSRRAGEQLNQLLFDGSSRFAAISLAAAIAKSSSDC